MKQNNETAKFNSIASFWAFLFPATGFIAMIFIYHQYAVIFALVCWFIPATIYVILYETKKENAKDFLRYSAMTMMFFVFIAMIVITTIVIG